MKIPRDLCAVCQHGDNLVKKFTNQLAASKANTQTLLPEDMLRMYCSLGFFKIFSKRYTESFHQNKSVQELSFPHPTHPQRPPQLVCCIRVREEEKERCLRSSPATLVFICWTENKKAACISQPTTAVLSTLSTSTGYSLEIMLIFGTWGKGKGKT